MVDGNERHLNGNMVSVFVGICYEMLICFHELIPFKA